ncbi:MAG: hypothetical protein AAFP84_19135 [Actinomycetota bacterium]
MFDQLHDPNPPDATGRHLATVAERASRIRRRRNATVTGAAAVGILTAGTVAIAAVGERDTNDVALTAEVAIDDQGGATIAETGDAPAPTTTVLDPASLPPAVPVNPDPDDDATREDQDGGATATADADTGADDAADATSEDADAGNDRGDGATGASDDQAPDFDVATAAALRAADPITAVGTTGAAVWFPNLDADPIEVFRRSDVTGLDFLDDGTAVVGTCCEPIVGTVLRFAADGSSADGELPTYGALPAVSPSGDEIAVLVPDDAIVGIIPGSADDTNTVPQTDTQTDTGTGTETGTDTDTAADDASGDADPDRVDVNGQDLMWLDADTVLVLGIDARPDGAWTLTTVALSSGEATTRPFALLDDFTSLRFAGRDGAGAIVVHDAGTEVVLAGSLDRYGSWDPDRAGDSGTSLEVRRLDESMRSVWYDGATEILVTLDGVLTVDGAELPGSYRSARR